jgi:opacity protein-like surface antigen
MKLRIIGLILFGLLIGAQPTEAAFGGFRVSGIFGLQYLKGRHWYAGGPGSPSNDAVARLGVISSLFGASAGYLFELGPSKIVLGAEIYGFLPQANPNLSLKLLNGSPEGSVSVKHNRSVGYVLTAGMMFNPKVMAYLSAGLESARYEFTYNFLASPGISPPLLPKQKLNHIFKAIMVGVGATYKVAPHLLVGLEASAPFFKRFKARSNPPRAFHYKPVEWRLALKLSYLF